MGLMKNKKQIALLLAISTVSGIITPTLMNLSNIESFAYSNDVNNLSEKEQEVLSIKEIITGAYCTFFLKDNGTVWATGDNSSGQLGIGNEIEQTSPVQVPITNVKEITAGVYHTVFLKNDGTVWATGHNSYGQLGIGNTVNEKTPVQVPITNVKNIISGGHYTFFIKNDGTVWATGNNGSGQLGIGHMVNQKTPVQVPINDVKEITANTNHTIFLKNDGTVWSTGNNYYGQLGTGYTVDEKTPVQVPIINVKEITTGEYHSVFLKNDGTVWATGYNQYGQLGIGNTTNKKTPVQVPITEVKDIVSGAYHTIFLKNDGTVLATGINGNGHLGIGNTTQQILPVQVPITDVENVTAGMNHTMFLKNDGTVWGTGRNGDGQLGIGNTVDQLAPIQIIEPLYNIVDFVLNAEQTKQQSDFDIAKTKVDELTDLTLKTNLLNRLNILQVEINNIKNATELIDKAEVSKLDNDINIAQDAINLITDNNIKTELQSRLDNIKNQIENENPKYNKQLQDTINKIAKAESSKTNFDITVAQTAINNLKESDKSLLQERLNALKEQIKVEQEELNYNKLLQEATDKVSKAENSKIDYDITVAQGLIDKLNPEDKVSLQLKINALKEQIRLEQEELNYNKLLQDAITKTTKAEETKTNYDITLAKDAINKLKSEDKTPLQDRINILEYNILLQDANLKVISAEELRTDTSISIAQVAVDKVPFREIQIFSLELIGKVQLQSKLDSLKLSIEEERYLQLLQEANTNVTNAESSKSLKDIKLAQMSIDRLKEIDKTPLQERLDNLKALLLQEEKYAQTLKLATTKVEQAEATKTQKYIDEAKVLVNGLKELQEKTNLLDRINAIEQIIITDNIKTLVYQADVYVKQAEALKREPYITKAQTAIDKLPACEEKTLLQARLDKVKK